MRNISGKCSQENQLSINHNYDFNILDAVMALPILILHVFPV